MPRIISGIQPSGKLHIGNYLGAIKNWVRLQGDQKNDCFFFIADYHSITEDYNPEEKSKEILDLAIDLLASELNPEKSIIFQQSQIPSHTELAWIFNTLVKIPELERMTQFKDKVKEQKHNINVGLFDYPVLMAADILIY
ncbi:MAG: tryptophan--tRNA ligase, partial [Candidatus Omnitrophota bacterium]|nr:tryptophan--tRNA ligase [Candidatus Omnitrophota bacterium]